MTRHGKHYRSLRPWEQADLHLLEIINRPEYLLGGFHNKAVMPLLFPTTSNDLRAQRAASGRTAYRLRLLLAHRLIRNISHSRRCPIAPKGRQICTMLLFAQHPQYNNLTQRQHENWEKFALLRIRNTGLLPTRAVCSVPATHHRPQRKSWRPPASRPQGRELRWV